MRLEEAFSLQFGQTITAERAYELFWAGIINDKRAFRCPGDGCTAQVTCANLDALEQDLKVQPHYRPYGEHATGCPFAGTAASPTTSSVGPDGHGFGVQDRETPDVFNLSRRPTISSDPLSRCHRRPQASRNRDRPAAAIKLVVELVNVSTIPWPTWSRAGFVSAKKTAWLEAKSE